MNSDLTETFISLYEHKYRSTTGRVKFKFKRSPHSAGFIDRFFGLLATRYGNLGSIGPDYLQTYLDHAFGKNAGRSFHGNQNVIPVNFILSKSTVEDFLNSSRARKWGMRTRLKAVALAPGLVPSVVKGSLSNRAKQQQESGIYTALPPEEEQQRLRFHNSLKGYVWCGQETTMFHPRSPACAGCKRRINCTARQRDNYPAIYRLRQALLQ